MEQIPDLLPWHQTEWSQLEAAHTAGRLPHALLFSGAEGMGKKLFVSRFAAFVLCGAVERGGPCGNCQSCRLIVKGNHPEYRCIEPEEPGKAIKIDHIRDFTSAAALTSQSGSYKITVIEPADAMTIEAANSLLKTLEEPVASTLILLITSKPGRLSATIRSRCQQIRFRPPATSQVIPWLKSRVEGVDRELLLRLALGSPLRVIEQARPELIDERLLMLEEFYGICAGRADPVATADRWNKQDLFRIVGWMYSWATDILRLKSNPDISELINSDQREHLKKLAQLLEFKKLYAILDQIYQALGSQGTQLNTQMILEGLLLSWAGGNSN